MKICTVDYSKMGEGSGEVPLNEDVIRFSFGGGEYVEFSIDGETIDMRANLHNSHNRISISPTMGNSMKIFIHNS